jgi:hypothetical protein
MLICAHFSLNELYFHYKKAEKYTCNTWVEADIPSQVNLPASQTLYVPHYDLTESDAYIFSINVCVIYAHHGSQIRKVVVSGVYKPKEVRTAISLATSHIIALYQL